MQVVLCKWPEPPVIRRWQSPGSGSIEPPPSLDHGAGLFQAASNGAALAARESTHPSE